MYLSSTEYRKTLSLDLKSFEIVAMKIWQKIQYTDWNKTAKRYKKTNIIKPTSFTGKEEENLEKKEEWENEEEDEMNEEGEREEEKNENKKQ